MGTAPGRCARSRPFSYIQRFGGPGEVANRVLLEAGISQTRSFLVIGYLMPVDTMFLRPSETMLPVKNPSAARSGNDEILTRNRENVTQGFQLRE